MAKASIRNLKLRRFMYWLCVDVFGKPAPRNPVKRRPVPRMTGRDYRRFEREWEREGPRVVARVMEMIEGHRGKGAVS